jgi:hypothetical protein
MFKCSSVKPVVVLKVTIAVPTLAESLSAPSCAENDGLSLGACTEAATLLVETVAPVSA